jgi:beta-phosphoglucomutase-like phosphatase (HAD superfamily)
MDAVCFDMDGVIVDSERYWTDLEEERILPAAGVDVSAEEITGMNYRDTYDYLDDEYGVDIERDEFLDRYEESAEKSTASAPRSWTGFVTSVGRFGTGESSSPSFRRRQPSG